MDTLFNTRAFSKIGQRDNNEDSIFPNPNEEYSSGAIENLFLVCDGVGGSQKGEIASDTICTQMCKFFIENDVQVSNAEIIKRGLEFVESKFDAIITESVESAGMGSTLTLLHLHEEGATVAHVGDSRVYLFREGKIIFRTKDHSRVQQYLDSGILEDEEEARNHPESNVILRAVRGASVGSTEADVHILTDLKEGDIFLLCSDGVIESFSNPELEQVFLSKPNLEAISATIIQKCNAESHDNFSAYFVQLSQAYIGTLKVGPIDTPGDLTQKEDFSTTSGEEPVTEKKRPVTQTFEPKSEEIIDGSFSQEQQQIENIPETRDDELKAMGIKWSPPKESGRSIKKLLQVILVLLALFFAGGAVYYFLYGKGKPKKDTNKVEGTENIGDKPDKLSKIIIAVKSKNIAKADSLILQIGKDGLKDSTNLKEITTLLDSLSPSPEINQIKEKIRKLKTGVIEADSSNLETTSI